MVTADNVKHRGVCVRETNIWRIRENSEERMQKKWGKRVWGTCV